MPASAFKAGRCPPPWPPCGRTARFDEIQQLLFALGDISALREDRLDRLPDTPLALHGAYTRGEALLALGDGTLERPSSSREGVRWVEASSCDVLLVTLHKSEKSFSPTTMYRDYALSRTRFHWESQNATHADTRTGRRYIEHEAGGTDIILFVRETETRANGSGAPFTCLGPVAYAGHEGARPMQITWRMLHPLPEALLETSQLIAAA